MLKRKKQLLGAFGLGTVATMLAAACMLPVSGAYAQDVDINVTVKGVGSSVTILTPRDGESITEDTLQVTTRLDKVSTVSHRLSCVRGGSQVYNEVVNNYTAPDGNPTSGDVSFSVALPRQTLGTEATCTLRASGTGETGGEVMDTVEFFYRAVHVGVEEKPSENGDPIIDIEIRDDVEEVLVQIYDENGKPMLDEPIRIPKEDFENGNYELKLPMDENGLPSGTYDVVVTGYDKDGNVISMNTTSIKYTSKNPVNPDDPNNPSNPGTPGTPGTEVPDVPGTGSVLGDMNIARLDYILTGLIAFGAVVGIAVYLMLRSRRREE